MEHVRKLLDKSSLGIEIRGETNRYIREKMIHMQEEVPAKRLLNLLDILHSLASSNDLKNILSSVFTAKNSNDTDRINTVL